MTSKSILRAAAAVALSLPLAALSAEYTLSSAPQSLADWRDGAFYEWRSAPAEDGTSVIIVPTGMEAEITDGMIGFANAMQRFAPQKNAAIIFNCAAAQSITCAVYRIEADSYSNAGRLVKKGAGELVLCSRKVRNSRGDYEVNLDIQGGLLRMPDYDVNDKAHDRALGINIAAGATFVPSVNLNAGSKAETQVWSTMVTGEGTIANDTSATKCTLLVGGAGVKPHVFAGDVQGKVNLLVYEAHQYFTNPAAGASYNGSITIQGANANGTAGIFGFVDPDLLKGAVYSHTSGSRLVYAGDTDGTVAGSYFVYDQAADKLPNVIDAGHHGGLTFNGLLRLYSDNRAMRVTLAGSNAVPCVIAGEIRGLYNNSSLFITKTGTGTWRFADYTAGNNRTALSGFWVKEGTVGFQTYGETNVTKCAFGSTPWFIADTPGAVADATKLTYQFQLGDSAGGTEGIFEYYGGQRFINRTRPFVIDGVGRILHNQTTNASYGVYRTGIYAFGTGATLVLDGEKDSLDAVHNLRDGMGSLGVEKRGGGTWTIAGTNNTFTGGIAVKEGTLVLRGVSGKFTWFRVVFTANRQKYYRDLGVAEEKLGSTSVEIGEFGLWNASGDRVNANFAYCPEEDAVQNLPTKIHPAVYDKVAPGEASYGWVVTNALNMTDISNYTLRNLFDGATGTKVTACNKVDGATRTLCVAEADARSYVPILMRLPRSVETVASYDVGIGYQYRDPDSGYVNYAVAMPKSWYLEGSVDGETWYRVDEVVDSPHLKKDNAWLYTGVAVSPENSAHNEGAKPICGYTNDVVVVYDNPVSVAAGATLEAEGLVKLCSLKADLSAAGGTVKGFILSDDFVLDVSGFPKGTAQMKMPVTFEDVTGLESPAGWTIKENGQVNPRIEASIVNGEIFLRRKGTVILYR